MIFEYDTLNSPAMLDPKPNLEALGIEVDTEVTEGSENVVTSGAVYAAVNKS